MNEQDATNNKNDDDVSGHKMSHRADAESAEGDDDVSGHKMSHRADAESAEGDDDVSGHVYVETPKDITSRGV